MSNGTINDTVKNIFSGKIAYLIIGTPTLISLFLIAALVGLIPSPLTRAMDQRAEEHQTLIKLIYQQKREQVAFLQLICLKLSNENDKKDCISVTIESMPR